MAGHYCGLCAGYTGHPVGRHPDTALAAAIAERNHAAGELEAFHDGALPLSVRRGEETIDRAESRLNYRYGRACAAVSALVSTNQPTNQ